MEGYMAKKNPQSENHDDALFETMQRNKKRRKRRIWITVSCIVLAVLMLLTATVVYLRNRVKNKFSAVTADVLTYTASTGSITTTVSGSGTLEDVDLENVTVPANVEVEEISVRANATIAAGDVIARVDLSSVMRAMSQVQAELDAFDEQLADAEDDAVSTAVTAGVSGREKEIYVAAGDSVADCMYDNGALMLLSVDGYLSAALDNCSLQVGASVRGVRSDGSELTAVVDSIEDGTATVLLSDDGTKNGETVSFYDNNDTLLGTAEVCIHNPLRITGFAGNVSSVDVAENTAVSAGTRLLTLTDTEYSSNYEAILRQREEKEEELMALLKLYHDGALLSPVSGSVSAVTDLDAEDSSLQYADIATEEKTEQLIATISPDKTMRITIRVDESDILSLEKEQTAEITIDSIGEDVFAGRVCEINKTATSDSGVTSYSAEILLDKTEHMLAGMSADAVIHIQGVENTIIIPKDALHQTSAASYVYTSYDESAKEYGGMVEVTTGPQPPPPMASSRPPTKPTGMIFLPVRRVLWTCTKARTTMMTPMTIRYRSMKGSSTSPMLERNHAPSAPPTIPGSTSFQSISCMTFFSFRWLMPETRVVKISAECTTALAMAEGSRATLLRKVRQLTP